MHTHTLSLVTVHKMTSNGQEATQIGFYQFDKVIGKGNFAVVKLATHTITDVKVSTCIHICVCILEDIFTCVRLYERAPVFNIQHTCFFHSFVIQHNNNIFTIHLVFNITTTLVCVC